MQLLNKNTDYAVRALIQLAVKKGEYVSSSEISREQDIPLAYVRRILQDLVKAGYIESKEGVSGGVKLKKDPAKITVSEMLRLFQGEIQISACMFRKKICSQRATCVLRKRINKIESKLVDEFSNITIRDLLRDMEV
jgi:Rrf2 family cysteine metabolism transcriptional repressor